MRPSRPTGQRRSLVAAIKAKYASGVDASSRQPVSESRVVVISGKVAEEVGFDKIRRQQARLDELKVVLLEGMCVAFAVPPDGLAIVEDRGARSGGGGGGGWWEKGGQQVGDDEVDDAQREREEEESIRETCPRITELDLGQNLLEQFEEVVKMAGELDGLKTLRIR